MFTWICPQCGREVPPSYTECPDCTKRAKEAAAAPPPDQPPVPQNMPPLQAPPPPPQQQYAPPPPQQQQYYQQPQYQQPPQYYVQPPQKRGGLNLPIWLMTILFALAIAGVVFGMNWLLSSNKGSAGNGPAPTSTVESPAAKPGAKASPFQKHIEISGVRFVPDPKKKGTLVKFLVINHSESDATGLSGNVTIWGRTQKSEEDAQGTFSFTTNLGPYESKEITAPVNTKLKIYELPDWQNITTDVQITAPSGS
jgi:hypothetical protein